MSNKKLILLLLFLILLFPAFADLPQEGNYVIEVIGTPDVLFTEINGNLWSFSVGDGIKTEQNVIIDKDKKTIIIPMFAVVADYFIYNIDNENYIDLYVGEKFNLNLFDAMISSMGGLSEINSVSYDASQMIVTEFEKVFLKIPILRFYKQEYYYSQVD